MKEAFLSLFLACGRVVIRKSKFKEARRANIETMATHYCSSCGTKQELDCSYLRQMLCGVVFIDYILWSKCSERICTY